MFGALYAAEGTAHEAERGTALEAVAREFSPRLEVCGPREITLDLSGLERLFGDARAIAAELRRTAADRGLRVRVAIAATRATARLFVHHRAGLTVIEPGREAELLASLPLSLLDVLANPKSQIPNPKSQLLTTNHHPLTTNHHPLTTNHHPLTTNHHPLTTNHHPPTGTLRQWGLRTLGEFAALPPDAVAARLGQSGVAWQRVARGEDGQPLVPAAPEERFEQALDLEWPIEGVEPLSFVLGRLMEPLSTHLERRDRGAAVLHVRLRLVTREIHERSLQLPAPMRDARALRTLALLDLESHPPAAAIDRVTVAVDPTPGRVVQYSLLTRPLPSPEQLSTLTARLAALMGERRCGSPVMVDSWRPGACAMKPFAPRESNVVHAHEPRRRENAELKQVALRDPATPRPVAVNDAAPVVALRRFRHPIPARVRVEGGRPVHVWIDPPSPVGLRWTSRRGFSSGQVDVAAGPWRTSGAWWESQTWDRDEWDVALAGGVTYRVFRERDSERWFVEGVVD